MINYKSFRKCISDNDNELIIYAADNFPQFPRRTSSVTSKCDRALPAATSNDLVVLRGRLDHEYHNWLRSLNLGSNLVVEYGEESMGKTLSELIINNPEPIKEIIRETGRKPIYVPWYSSNIENEAAKILCAELFGAPGSESLKYNDKASFKIICQQLNIPVVEGIAFEMNPQNGDNYNQMKDIIKDYLRHFDTVIIRGTLGESGMSLYKTNGNDIAEIYLEISNSGEKVIIIEPFLEVSSSPNDQWIISRDRSIHHLGMRDQICKKGMVHTSTINKVEISDANSKYINETSFKIVNKMAKTGYKGVVGIDYIVSDKGLFPVENNARFNGSSYVSLIVDNIEKLNAPIPYWKFIKIKTAACSFPVLAERIKQIIYDGEKLNSVFPYNCDVLPLTGDFSVVIIAENMNQIFTLEESLHEMGIGVKMAKTQHGSTEKQIDDAAVKRYFDNTKGGKADSVSMIAHEHNLPANSVRYRLNKEKRSISDWLDAVNSSGRVLDVGCGSGTWTEIFAKRYKTVIGIEQSSLMLKAARERVAHLPNVKIIEGDVRHGLPEGSFDMIFLGGLCMYLNDHDVMALLHSLKSHLVKGGAIILRESTVKQNVSLSRGEYQAVYRSVNMYRQLFGGADSFHVEVRRNYGYTNLVTAEEMVNLRRKWLPFLPRDSTMLGSFTWWALRGVVPISFWALPRLLSQLSIQWPRLQNHFFRLRLPYKGNIQI